MNILTKYNQSATFDCPLQVSGSQVIYRSATLAAGDVTISKDGGGFANVTNLPTESASGSGNYPLTLTASELTAARVLIRFEDQDIPPAFAPTHIRLETYGDEDAGHVSFPASLVATGLDEIDITSPSGVATTFREMVVQLWRRFFKKTTLDGATITTYADDGTTVVTEQIVSDDGSTQTQGTAS